MSGVPCEDAQMHIGDGFYYQCNNLISACAAFPRDLILSSFWPKFGPKCVPLHGQRLLQGWKILNLAQHVVMGEVRVE